MAITARRTTFNSIVVMGIALDAGRVEVQHAAESFAEWLQEQIAETFESERTFGGKLSANTAAWNERKAAGGLDSRRGHATGALQDALYDVKLWRIRYAQGRVTIVVSESPLFTRIPYAEYYQEAKAKNQTIVGFKAEWAKAAPGFFRGLEQRGRVAGGIQPGGIPLRAPMGTILRRVS